MQDNQIKQEVSLNEIKVGDKFVRNADKHVLKVMAIVDNWCMVRYKGAAPFTIHLKDLKSHVSLLKLTPQLIH